MARKKIEYKEGEFRRLVAYGMSWEDIGAWYGATHVWARTIAKRLGVYIHRQRDGRKFTIDKSRIRTMDEQGVKAEDMAETFGCSISTVYRLMKEYEITRRQVEKEKPKPKPKTVPEYLDDGARRLVEKRNSAIRHFLQTGDTSMARAYCAKYKVYAPANEEAFKKHLCSVAGTMREEPVCKAKKKRRKGGKLKKFTKEQLQALIEKGLYCDEIAKELNCAQTTVCLWRRKYGLPYPARREPAKKNTWTRLNRDVLKKLCDQKLTLVKIAEHFGVGPNIVRRNIQEYGIERESLRPGRK